MVSSKINFMFLCFFTFSLNAYWSDKLGADNCLVPLENQENLFIPTACIPSSDAKIQILAKLPARILDWGSNGLSGAPWSFADSSCNKVYEKIFHEIATKIPKLLLSPHDLFHAHLIASKSDLVMVFHAKEYPSDLEIVKNYYQNDEEDFCSYSPEFEDRNFLFIQNGEQASLALVKNQGACEELFDEISPNTLSEEKVKAKMEDGEFLGDINYFVTDTLKRLKFNFYPGFDFYTGNLINDLEQINTGKSLLQRHAENRVFDLWLSKQQESVLYFLTGKEAF